MKKKSTFVIIVSAIAAASYPSKFIIAQMDNRLLPPPPKLLDPQNRDPQGRARNRQKDREARFSENGGRPQPPGAFQKNNNNNNNNVQRNSPPRNPGVPDLQRTKGKAGELDGTSPEDNVPHGKELVSIEFPNGVALSDIIKTVGYWTGKNFVLGQGVSGGAKISIISSEKVTKEEAYQAFLSALNIAGFTTVDTGKIVKILPIANAKSSNIKTYYGSNWAPATDEIINQVIPLYYVDANSIINQLRTVLGQTQYSAFTTTNSLILTDTGNRIKKLLEIVKLLDDKTNQAQVTIIPINYMDAKDAVAKISDIFGTRQGSALILQKALVDERTNSAILVGSSRGLDDVVRFIERIDQPSNLQRTQSLIRVRPLDYADAEKIAQTLQALAQNTTSTSLTQKNNPAAPNIPPFAGAGLFPTLPQTNPLNPQGQDSKSVLATDLAGIKVTADKATNSLIIQGSKGAYDELETIISQLDQRRAQIYIEADIVDLQTSNGLAWTPSALGGAQAGSTTIPFGFNAQSAIPLTVTQGTGTTQTSNLTTLSSSLGQNAVLGILTNSVIDLPGGIKLNPGAIIAALKQDANANVLQTPSMIVSDNETANFSYDTQYNVAAQVANPAAGGGTVTQLKSYDVITSLKVKPQISKSNSVNLDITLQLDDSGPIDPTTGYPNPIFKRSANSIVTVHSGQTAVLGGITKDSTKESEAKVPLLGDIPVIGWLFKSVTKSKEKLNLTLFLTPYVIRNSEDLAKIYQQKMKDRDEFLKYYYGESYKKENFYSILPKPEDGMVNPKIDDDGDTLVSQNETAKKSNSAATLKNPRARTLPTQDPNPINAPAGGTGSGASAPPAPSAFSNQPPPQMQPFAPSAPSSPLLPPPPPLFHH